MKILDNPAHSQAHCLVAQSDTHPKPAKELAYTDARQTDTM